MNEYDPTDDMNFINRTLLKHYSWQSEEYLRYRRLYNYINHNTKFFAEVKSTVYEKPLKKQKYKIYDPETKELLAIVEMTDIEARHCAAIDGYFIERYEE